MLFREGANAKQVQAWLGHHSAAFTLNRYIHALDDDLPDPAFLDRVVNGQRGHTEATEPSEIDADPYAVNAGV